ncbi:ATP-binding protein [Endozoicomonas numazuensis]|uniref:ATPase n=1 Tax=Endozoicomonas numazuensis TaxID=1137799 RepID=A0A081NG10_9GAMM|nr:ATP-binding protein [Endozoicomonas numazuensis]KEQ17383.1 ATPase [Endozoicomonas numazuensis]
MITISEKEIMTRFYFDNPWWDSQEVEGRYKSFPRRFYFEPFYNLVRESSINRAAVLMGSRRVGKTVMVFQTVDRLLDEGVDSRNILYVSLETPMYTGLSLEKIINFFKEEFSHSRDSELIIIFDEIQYLPGWEVHLKSLVDSYPSYKFVATGSAAAALKLKSRESGAGRFTEFLLPPLTFAEYISFIGRADELITFEENDGDGYWCAKDINKLNDEFVNYLNFGGYPEAVFSPLVQAESSRYIKSDIIDKVLLRDLPSLYGINDVQELNKLFNTIAYNTGNEITLESLSKSSGVSKNTIKKYIEYLEAAFLIKIVHRVDISAKKFKRATTFKVYLTNPSMRAALFGPVTSDHDAMGALTETAIFSQWVHNENIENLHYARWNSGEVDIVWLNLATQKPYWCVEVKWSDLPCSDTRMLKGLISFVKQHNLPSGLVTTRTVMREKNINNTEIRYLPSAAYTYALGVNILKGISQRVQ